MAYNNRQIGTGAELIARDYLEQNNCKVIDVNYRTRYGEVDIIFRDNQYLVFGEVKYRRTLSKGFPEEAVNYYKQRTICKVMDFYRMSNNYSEFTPIRFDVICLIGNDVKWYKNAFPYIK